MRERAERIVPNFGKPGERVNASVALRNSFGDATDLRASV
jgi:hypothetical protein